MRKRNFIVPPLKNGGMNIVYKKNFDNLNGAMERAFKEISWDAWQKSQETYK